MVLQREAPIQIWGWADPGERVQVTFRDQTASSVAAQDGRWSITLPSQFPGGPWEMTISGSNTLTLHNVMTGDVWLASGQSNMEFMLKEAGSGLYELSYPQSSEVRLFHVPRRAELVPASDIPSASWQVASQETARDFSAVAYLFGAALQRRYKVSIGLIEAAYGGTHVQSWMGFSTLQRFPQFKDDLEAVKAAPPNGQAHVEAYLAAYAAWAKQHRDEDRGMSNGGPLWAAPDFDDRSWPKLPLPRPDSAWGIDFDRYDGAIWYRKAIEVPQSVAGRPVALSFGRAFLVQQAFFNGVELSPSIAKSPGRFTVPADLVKAGKAVLCIRAKGLDGWLMLYGPLESFYAQSGEWKVPLAGEWPYQTGADLSGIPKLLPLAHMLLRPGVTVLKNGMIAPLTPYRIRGVIWYQGEANVPAPALYRSLFPALIEDWRRDWGYQFPFLFVQLAGYDSDPSEPADSPTAELREAQTCALDLPQTGMATAVDIGNEQDIHPKNKAEVARRLLLTARRIAYQENVLDSGPVVRSAQVDGHSVHLHFGACGSELQARGEPLQGFAIAADRGKFVWAEGPGPGMRCYGFEPPGQGARFRSLRLGEHAIRQPVQQ